MAAVEMHHQLTAVFGQEAIVDCELELAGLAAEITVCQAFEQRARSRRGT